MENSLAYVYTVVDNKVKKVQVTTGISDEKSTEIVKGLKAGDQVIIDGQAFLNEGQKVKIAAN
jgi:multidrug efflux pump subunit AcrA (membrane-fusion protein)